ncbi:ABC transporter ATP-binding protein [Vallicoccus soli]|uniref:ABC transporter ATP-binding protein n=1 Tax=Vallicoccus soli TaxID=2339232 RepID=A0A3A3ZDJ9_9ACTN|nr:ABC transporter ATP-binding protein [Vallicoccus soli]
MRALLPYLREHRAALALAVLLALVGSAAALAQPLLVQRVLDGVGAGRAVGGAVALLVVLMLGTAVVSSAQQYLLQRTGEGVVLTARRGLAEHLLRLPVVEYDRRAGGDLVSRLGADTTQLRAVITSGAVEALSGVVVVAGALVAMLLIDPLLLAVTVAAVAAGAGVVATAARRLRALSRVVQERVGDMTAAVTRALRGVRTIRASGAEEREVAAVGRSAEAAYGASLRVARLEALVAPAMALATQGSFLLVLALGGARVASGALGVGELVAFVLYLFLLVLPLAQALRAFATLQTGLGALGRIEEVRALPRETDGDPAAAPPPVPGAPVLELDGVSFAYEEGVPVLHAVSFAVPRGTRTALVGPSGSGKSTLLALVERFYDPTAGAVRLEGVDVREVPRAALRARTGYVEQEAPALAGSLRDNLLLAAPGATDADLVRVLAEVNLADLAHRTPAGLDAPVGDGGVMLSGGERQRLALARVLLARPPLLLLDEPTSNLDARNEVALRGAVDAVAADRTLVVVAHRLSTVVDADQIVVLDAGRVVAVGRHEELVRTSPLYRELAASQLLVARS